MVSLSKARTVNISTFIEGGIELKVIVEYVPEDSITYKSWFVIKDELEGKFSKDTSSPWEMGVEAQTGYTYYPVDNAVITLFPAKSSDKKDDLNGDRYKGKYLIQLSNTADSERFSSYKMYTWEEAINIIS